MAEITIQELDVLSGVAPTLVAAEAGGDHLVPDGAESLILHVANGDAADHTVTVDDVNSPEPIGASTFDADVAVVVPAGEERLVNLKQLNRFLSSSSQINVSYDAVTSVTVTAYRVR